MSDIAAPVLLIAFVVIALVVVMIVSARVSARNQNTASGDGGYYPHGVDAGGSCGSDGGDGGCD